MSESVGEAPISRHQNGWNEWQEGMTYRQWLIGQVLCGLCADSGCDEPVETALFIVDGIIGYLDKEKASSP